MSEAPQLLDAIGELALAIAPHSMDSRQRKRIAQAVITLVNHIIELNERPGPTT
jgi:hypothetical protein